MRKNIPHKFIYHITRDDKMMIAVNNEVDETYINKIMTGTFTPKGVEAKAKAEKIQADIKKMAEANKVCDTYKHIVLEADELECEIAEGEETEHVSEYPNMPAWGGKVA